MQKEEKENKDYIINLRVSRATYEKVKQKARENKESISSLLRKVMDDSVEVISDISHDLMGKEKGKKFKDIVGYYKLKTAQDIACDQCGSSIVSGETATVGETANAKKYFFCNNCK